MIAHISKGKYRLFIFILFQFMTGYCVFGMLAIPWYIKELVRRLGDIYHSTHIGGDIIFLVYFLAVSCVVFAVILTVDAYKNRNTVPFIAYLILLMFNSANMGAWTSLNISGTVYSSYNMHHKINGNWIK